MIVSAIRRYPNNWPSLFRLVASASILFVVSIILWVDYDQRQLRIPDPFGYDLAIELFADGKWYLEETELNQGLVKAVQNRENLVMFVPIDPDRFAFRKSPGYPLLAIPFQRLGVPRLANISVALIAAFFLFRTLSDWRNERFAMIALIVLLFSPISLLALHYATMDTFVSGGMLVIAGSILINFHQNQKKMKTNKTHWPLLLAGLTAGWAVVVRIHSLPVLIVASVFLVFTITAFPNQSIRNRVNQKNLILFSIGVTLSLFILIYYNKVVFGHFFDTGYRYQSPFQHLFLWEKNAAHEVYGVTTWIAEGTVNSLLFTIGHHILQWSGPLLRGWPLFPLVFSILIYLLVRRQLNPYYFFLFAWIAATYALYSGIFYFGVTRELVVPVYRTTGFFAVARYLYPAVFPITLLTVEALIRLPKRLMVMLMSCFVIGSLAWYFYIVG